MKPRNFVLLGFVFAASTTSAFAAGVSQTVKTTIDETQLQGYTATPPAGWTQVINYTVATAATEPVQKIAAIVFEYGNAPTLPQLAGITTIAVDTGAILTKDTLPFQVKATDCNLPNYSTFPTTYDACPNVSFNVLTVAALPNRLLIYGYKSTYKRSTSTFGAIQRLYAFDPAAGAANRWTLLQESISDASSILYQGSFSGGGAPDTNLYLFKRASPTQMQVVQVQNK